jgi:hypothetical protein
MRQLTRGEWEDLCRRVFERDLYQVWLHGNQTLSFARWLVVGSPCVAPMLDPMSGPCSGRITFDHVKDRPKIGDPIVKRHTQDRKAPDDERHLQSVCEHHHGLDVVGGAGWATTEAAREISRAYLASLYLAADQGPSA